jgi:hypothetical protein
METSDLIDGFADDTLTVTRRSGAYSQTGSTSGQFVASSTTTFPAVCSVQPLTADEMVRIEEGARDREWLNLFTVTEMRPARDGGVMADRVTIDGRLYEVDRVERWRGNYFKVIVCTVQAGTVGGP